MIKSNKNIPIALLIGITFATFNINAKQICNAKIHQRFGETRSWFKDVLGTCRPNGYCSIVIILTDKQGDGYTYFQQLRIARPHYNAPYQVELVAADPLPKASGHKMLLTVNGTTFDLTNWHIQTDSSNEFRISKQAIANQIVMTMKQAKTAQWTYESVHGSITITFPLRGLNAALRWIDCAKMPR